MDIYRDPMLNIKDAATYLGVPQSTLTSWVKADAISSVDPEKKGWPSLPFVAAIEAYVLRQLRNMKIPRRNIIEAAAGIREKLGRVYGLATPGMGVSGQDILVEVAGEFYRGADLQQAANETMADFKNVIRWNEGHPSQLRLTNFGADVILDPRFGWGRPVVESNKVPITALAGQYLGGDSYEFIAEDFDMDAGEVERIVEAYLSATKEQRAA